MEESNNYSHHDLNTLAYDEFIELLERDSTIPVEWKLAFIGSSISNFETALENFEKIIDDEVLNDASDKPF
ncbi:MAG: hypothetical protein ACIAQZ_10065 [Sedimentisphaeraceae bacterium JB056]